MYTEKVLQHVSYHEAGHIVMILNAERKFDFVTVNPTPNYDGMVFGVKDYQDETYAVQNALIASAGLVAEKMKFGEVRDPAIIKNWDIGVMNKMITHTYGPHNSVFGYNEIIRTANYVLKTRWDEVEQIAQALIHRGALTYEECKSLIKY